MSETEQQPTDTARPWHVADNPFEALYQHFEAGLAAIRKDMASPHTEAAQKQTRGTAEPGSAAHEEQGDATS